jgi:uncharacterized protein
LSNKVFVDTSGWANLFISSDSYHQQTIEWFSQARQRRIELVTTNYIITELIALLQSPLRVSRPRLFEYVDSIKKADYVSEVYISATIHAEAYALLKERLDKEWSLVDATSFLIMRELQIQEALTTDRHFEQAGFIRLLR